MIREFCGYSVPLVKEILSGDLEPRGCDVETQFSEQPGKSGTYVERGGLVLLLALCIDAADPLRGGSVELSDCICGTFIGGSPATIGPQTLGMLAKLPSDGLLEVTISALEKAGHAG